MGTMLPLVGFLLLLSGSTYSSRSNGGTTFIVGFMDNSLSTRVDLEAFVTTMANTPAVVTVTTPLHASGWSSTATVARLTVELILIPYELRCSGTGHHNKGVQIVSTQEITVYCVNKERYTTDAYVAFPINVIGQEYFAMSYAREAAILVVGTQDSTAVTVKLSDNSRSGSISGVSSVSISYGGTTYGNGQSMNFNINKWQCFYITQSGTNSDLTGSYITSNKPMTCITGNLRVSVPVSSGSSDHLTEMIPSVDTWGKEFMTVSSPDRGIGDYFRILAAEDGTTVTFGSGISSCSLSRAGDFCEKDIGFGAYTTISGNKPIIVGMFQKTWQSDGPNYGDPAMSLLIPTPQFAAEYTWSTTNLPDGNPFNNKVAFIAPAASTGGMMLDNAVISGSWSAIAGTSVYKTTWKYVQPGSHNVYHSDPTVTFMAMAVGTERYNSYAFIAGARMAQLNIICVPSSPVAGDVVDNDCDGNVDEEALDGIDNDGDGAIDEDLALPPRIDGNWGSWGGWGSCSVACGAIGTQDKVRLCNNPAPQNNGEDCAGNGLQTQNCDMRSTPCPIHGGFTSWSGWGSCSVTCASGTHYNTRSCTNPAPQHGGNACSGDTSLSQTCNTGVSCAIHGNWGAWGGWGGCSVTCETGSKGRTRSCNNPAPAHGGNQCAGSATDTGVCDAGLMCPIDGVWAAWNGWAGCSVTCETGTWTRQRTCSNPAPQYNGANCGGAADQTTACNAGIMCPIDGVWGGWAPWAGCSVTCELGTWTRDRQCDSPTPQYNGANCGGVGDQTQGCDAGIMCPIDGQWGTWGLWGTCSVTCEGAGTRERTRTCDRPTPQYNGAYCPASNLHTEGCDYNHVMCPTSNQWQPLYFSYPTVAPIDGGVGSWGDWTACSLSCLGGIRLRRRHCNNPVPQGAGAPCSEQLIEESTCNNNVPCWPGGYSGVPLGGQHCNASRGLFACANGVQCIDIIKKCDCVQDCMDESDEITDLPGGCLIGLSDCENKAGSATPGMFTIFLATVISLCVARLAYQ